MGVNALPLSTTFCLSCVLYKSVDDVDLFIGVLGEWAIKGGIVGPVTSCIMADQFARLKDGDRFFYEHGGQSHSFTPGLISEMLILASIIKQSDSNEAQLDSIRSMSLARVLCETSDTVDWITPNVFWTPSPMYSIPFFLRIQFHLLT